MYVWPACWCGSGAAAVRRTTTTRWYRANRYVTAASASRWSGWLCRPRSTAHSWWCGKGRAACALQDLLGGPAGGGKASLRVDVQRFDTVPGRYASLEAVWRLKQQGQAELTCRTSVQTAADNSIISLVNAHQANLRKLAEAVRGSALQGSCRA